MSPDAMLDALGDLAAASFPEIYKPDRRFAELGARYGGFGAFAPSLAVPQEHPARAAAISALANDPLLRVFAESDDPGVFISANLGRGWRLTAEQLPSAIVGSAAARVVAEGKPTDELQALRDATGDVLDELRRAIDGDEVRAIAVTAFEGVALPAQARVELPWGILRPATQIEEDMQPFGGMAPTAILVSRPPLRIRLGDPDEPLSFFDQEAAASQQVASQHVALAVLLAVEREDFAVAIPVWSTQVLPAQIGWGFSGSVSTRLFSRSPGEPLREGEIERLRVWAALVAQYYDPSIQVAVRRTLSAIRERIDAEDALIDAVVAWENLFGHGGQTEVIFRVTSALTLLLERDPAKRATLRTALGKVYAVRSTVVHGGELRPKDDLQGRKELAIRTAIDALRSLLRDHPRLIKDRERGLRLILQHTAKDPTVGAEIDRASERD